MRGVAKFLAILVFVLVIAWLGLWWYAEGRMQSGYAGWAAQLATQGWKISDDAEKRGTSPGAAKLTLVNLVLTSPPDASGRAATVSLPSVALRIDLLNPLVLHTDLPNKINIDIGAQMDAAVTFGSITDSQTLDPHLLFTHQSYPFKSGDASAANIDILASQGSLLVLHIDNFTAHVDENRDAGANANAIAVSETLDGIALSPLMTKLLSIPFGGKISHFGITTSLSGPVPAGLRNMVVQVEALQGNLPAQQKLLVPALHNWAAAGGNGRLGINLVVGPTTLASAASITFDKSAQPSGTADITANHLDQLSGVITAAYPQVQDQIAQAEARLSPHLTTTNDGGQTLTVHATYGAGAVAVNGQKVAPLPPIDWATLENLPALPPLAPDDGSGSP